MLAKWNPLDVSLNDGRIARSAWQVPVFDELFREADQLFSRPWPTMSGSVHETDDATTLSIDLPGHDPKNVDLKIEGDVLTVKSQRTLRSGAREEYARSFVIPTTVDTGKVEAKCEHGVLTVTLPRREEAKPRSITVKVS